MSSAPIARLITAITSKMVTCPSLSVSHVLLVGGGQGGAGGGENGGGEGGGVVSLGLERAISCLELV